MQNLFDLIHLWSPYPPWLVLIFPSSETLHSKKVSNFKAYIFPLFSTWFEAATGNRDASGDNRVIFIIPCFAGLEQSTGESVAARSYARASQRTKRKRGKERRKKRKESRWVSRYRSVGKALVSSLSLSFFFLPSSLPGRERGEKGGWRSVRVSGTVDKTRGCREDATCWTMKRMDGPCSNNYAMDLKKISPFGPLPRISAFRRSKRIRRIKRDLWIRDNFWRGTLERFLKKCIFLFWRF